MYILQSGLLYCCCLWSYVCPSIVDIPGWSCFSLFAPPVANIYIYLTCWYYLLVAEFETTIGADHAAGTPRTVGRTQHGHHSCNFIVIALKDWLVSDVRSPSTDRLFRQIHIITSHHIPVDLPPAQHPPRDPHDRRRVEWQRGVYFSSNPPSWPETLSKCSYTCPSPPGPD